jgi:NAD(P)-dependent dehydrogenase (short-subunit alcohol dehydrogenase family)
MEFRDRHVVVTGGSGALGQAVVAALIEAGAHCHVPWIDAAALAGLAVRNHPRLRLARCDLTDETAVATFYSEVPRLWASLHLAGGFAMRRIAESDKAALAAMLDVNLVSCFLCCAAAVRAMRAGGAGGRIVNVAARPALEWRSGAGMTAYAAAKAAVAALTVALAEEVVQDGILVNAVAPSILDTPANRAAMPRAEHERWPKVEDVTRTILFLASADNRVTRGAVVPVYGRS